MVKIVSVLVRGRTTDNIINKFLQTPKRRTTLNSFMKRRSNDQFEGPAPRQPGEMDDDMTRKLLAIAASKTSRKVMETHYFTICKRIFRQSDGCPIGLDMSVEAAAIYMLLWDEEFLKALKRLGITVELFKRYVDDILMILRSINRGWKYSSTRKKMVYDIEDEDLEGEDDDYTFRILLEIANGLDDDIQLTYEVPSGHEDGRLPVLDLGLQVVDNKIQHFFYRKGVTSPYCIMYNSAISVKTKRDSLLQEGLRRIRNTCKQATQVEKRRVLGEYMNMLRISGYDVKYRYNLLNGILKREKQIEGLIQQGLRVRFRSREQIINEKKQKLGKYANTWFLRNDNINPLKIPATPASELKNRVHKSLMKRGVMADGGFTKVIEMGGNLVTQGLSTAENFGGQGSCYMGQACNMDADTDCRVSRSVYQTECQTCLEGTDPQTSAYVGTTGCVSHKRTREHMNLVRLHNQTNAQSKHHWEEHPNNIPRFKTTILKGGIRYNLDRQICESLYIERYKNNADINLLNQRSEWGHQGIPRLQVV